MNHVQNKMVRRRIQQSLYVYNYTTKLKTERHVIKLDWSKADAGGIPCCQTCCGRIMFTPHVALLSSMFIFLYVTKNVHSCYAVGMSSSVCGFRGITFVLHI